MTCIEPEETAIAITVNELLYLAGAHTAVTRIPDESIAVGETGYVDRLYFGIAGAFRDKLGRAVLVVPLKHIKSGAVTNQVIFQRYAAGDRADLYVTGCTSNRISDNVKAPRIGAPIHGRVHRDQLEKLGRLLDGETVDDWVALKYQKDGGLVERVQAPEGMNEDTRKNFVLYSQMASPVQLVRMLARNGIVLDNSGEYHLSGTTMVCCDEGSESLPVTFSMKIFVQNERARVTQITQTPAGEIHNKYTMSLREVDIECLEMDIKKHAKNITNNGITSES